MRKALLFLYDYPLMNDAVRVYKEKFECILVLQRDEINSDVDELKKNYSKCVFVDSLINYDNLRYEIEQLMEEYDVYRIITVYEPMVEIAGRLRSDFHIPGLSYEQAILVRNKFEMKKFLSKQGIRCANVEKVNSNKDYDYFFNKNGFPIIFKPIDGAATGRTHTVYSKNQLIEIITKYDQGDYIIEEFIDGEEYHVDAIIQDNKVVLNSVGKYSDNVLNCIEGDSKVGSVIFSKNTQSELIDKLKNTHIEVIKLLNLNNCICHSEFFVTKSGEIIFSEIAARIGGGKLIGPAIKYIYGIDVFQAAIDLEIGEKISKTLDHPDDFCGFTTFDITNINGKIVRIATSDDFKIKDIIELKIINKVGDLAHKAVNSAQRLGYIIFSGKSFRDIVQKIDSAQFIFNCNTEITEKEDKK